MAPYLQVGERRDALSSPPVWPIGLAPVDSRPGVWKYIGWGALIGGTLAGGYTAYRVRDCDGCFLTGFVIGGAAAAGAVLGGFIGSLVYADRYWSHDR